MANITDELQTIATSVYGSEMRTAIHDAIDKVNDYGTGYVDMVSIQIGEAGVSQFFGSIDITVSGDVATIRDFSLRANPDNPYVRPSGTIIDTVGLELFTLPTDFAPGDIGDTKFYLFPNGDGYNGDIAYLKFEGTNPVVKLYYGWNDVLDSDTEYHAQGTYFV